MGFKYPGHRVPDGIDDCRPWVKQALQLFCLALAAIDGAF